MESNAHPTSRAHGDAVRARIVAFLREHPISTTYAIADHLCMTTQATKYHLDKMYYMDTPVVRMNSEYSNHDTIEWSLTEND
jgi:DNA-binding MarR family transcriptional regulator